MRDIIEPPIRARAINTPLRKDSIFRMARAMNEALPEPIPDAMVEVIAAKALKSRPAAERDSVWVPMEFDPMLYRRGGFRARLLESGLDDLGYHFRENPLSGCPEIALNGKWENLGKPTFDFLHFEARTKILSGGLPYKDRSKGEWRVAPLCHFDWNPTDLRGAVAKLLRRSESEPPGDDAPQDVLARISGFLSKHEGESVMDFTVREELGLDAFTTDFVLRKAIRRHPRFTGNVIRMMVNGRRGYLFSLSKLFSGDEE